MAARLFCVLICCSLAMASEVSAQGITRIHGDVSRDLLGDGTGVVIGVIDSGVDDTHPGLSPTDSLGNPRMVAEGNFVPTEPGSSGDDVAGHGTSVAGIILSADPNLRGLAPDARYVNSRVLDSGNGFSTTFWVENGAGFAIDNGADILNLSLNTFSEFSDGALKMDMLLDWAAYEQGVTSVVCAGNINQASGNDPNVRAPAGSFNSIAVGWTSAAVNYDQVHFNSSIGPTSDGRIKPDVLAPGHQITTLSDDWESQSDYRSNQTGCSFATPHVSGLLAQQIDYGRVNGLSTNPLALKATLLNSADKAIFDKNGEAWSPYASTVSEGVLIVTSGLDDHLGAGQVDGLALYEQYSAGEQEAGIVGEMGWDLASISDENSTEYLFDANLKGGTMLTATLTWFRELDYFDDGDGIIDSGDSYSVMGDLDNLDLSLLIDGVTIAASVSTIDNVEHLYFLLPTTGAYSLQVDRLNVFGSGSDTLYGLAWSATAVPEPGSAALISIFGIALMLRRRRSSSSPSA